MRKILPWFGLTGVVEADVEVVVLGCPVECGDAYRGGSAGGPEAIRRWSATAEAVTEEGSLVDGVRVIDLGDVGPEVREPVAEDAGDVDDALEPPELRWLAIEADAKRAWQAHPRAFHLALGGDHAVTPPLAAAARSAHDGLGFLLLDAHPDAFESYEGDPLSHACVLSRLWDRCGFAPQVTCVAGLRSYALDELEALRSIGLVVTASRWADIGSPALAEEVLQTTGGKPLYLSLDIDVLDPAHAPGTGYPVAGGLSVRQLLDLLEAVWQRQPVVAMDLVEVAPCLDPSGATAATAAHVCLQVIGHAARHLR